MEKDKYYEFHGKLGMSFFLHTTEDSRGGIVRGDEAVLHTDGAGNFSEGVETDTAGYKKTSRDKFEAAKEKAKR